MSIVDGQITFPAGRKPRTILAEDCPKCSLAIICEVKTKEGYGVLTPSRGDHRTDTEMASEAACLRERGS